MTISTETITLHSDGSEMEAFVARPESGVAPALIVLQEAFGVNDHIRDVTKRFAQQGYLSIAPELFHRTAPPGFVAGYGDMDAIRSHFSPLTADALALDVRAVFDWILTDRQGNNDRIGAIGYCLGGKAAFIANAELPLTAACAYYGGGMDQLLPLTRTQHAPMLFCWGGQDKHITSEKRRAVIDAMTEAQKPYVHLEFSEADHAFFCDARQNYNPTAARQAWALTLSFLATYLKP